MSQAYLIRENVVTCWSLFRVILYLFWAAISTFITISRIHYDIYIYFIYFDYMKKRLLIIIFQLLCACVFIITVYICLVSWLKTLQMCLNVSILLSKGIPRLSHLSWPTRRQLYYSCVYTFGHNESPVKETSTWYVLYGRSI